MQRWIRLETNMEESYVYNVLEKVLNYFPGRPYGHVSGWIKGKGQNCEYRYELDPEKDPCLRKGYYEHPVTHEIKDAVFCLCQLHGPSLIASIIGNMPEKKWNDREGAIKRINNCINHFIEAKIYEIADRSLSKEELTKIFFCKPKKENPAKMSIKEQRGLRGMLNRINKCFKFTFNR